MLKAARTQESIVSFPESASKLAILPDAQQKCKCANLPARQNQPKLANLHVSALTFLVCSGNLPLNPQRHYLTVENAVGGAYLVPILRRFDFYVSLSHTTMT